jgi:hypothetical protein
MTNRPLDRHDWNSHIHGNQAIGSKSSKSWSPIPKTLTSTSSARAGVLSERIVNRETVHLSDGDEDCTALGLTQSPLGSTRLTPLNLQLPLTWGAKGGNVLEPRYSWDLPPPSHHESQWKKKYLKTKAKRCPLCGSSSQKKNFSRGLGALVHHHGVLGKPVNLQLRFEPRSDTNKWWHLYAVTSRTTAES